MGMNFSLTVLPKVPDGAKTPDPAAIIGENCSRPICRFPRILGIGKESLARNRGGPSSAQAPILFFDYLNRSRLIWISYMYPGDSSGAGAVRRWMVRRSKAAVSV
jgi:hypothetical protein